MEIWLAILGWKFPSKVVSPTWTSTQAHRPHKKESHHGSRHRHPCSSALSSPAATHATTRNSTTTIRPYGTRVTACDQIPSLSAAAATKTATSTKSAMEHGLQINCCRRPFVWVVLISPSPNHYFVLFAIWYRGIHTKTSSLLWVRYSGKGGTKGSQCLSHQFSSHYCISLHFRLASNI